MNNIHPVQIEILKNLLFNPEARFSELNTTDLSNDQFTYHLKKLIEEGLINKSTDKVEMEVKSESEGKGKRQTATYYLTPQGLEFAGKIDHRRNKLTKQPKIGVLALIVKDNKVLLTRRKKSQSLGLIGYPTEKIRLNESLNQTLDRLLDQELGLKHLSSQYFGLVHIVNTDKGRVVLDVILQCFKITDFAGSPVPETEEGINTWVDLNQIDDLEDSFVGLNDAITASTSEGNLFLEIFTEIGE